MVHWSARLLCSVRQLRPVMKLASSIHYQEITPDDSSLTIHDFLKEAGKNKAALVAA